MSLLAFGFVGCIAALWLLFADRRQSGARHDRTVRWPWLAAGSAAFAAGLLTGPAGAGVAAAVVAICSWCTVMAALSRRRVVIAESVSQFAAILANQAQVSRTVVDALETAVPLATGPVADTASQLVRRCRALGVEAAAQQFAAEAGNDLAAWLADVVAVAAGSGGQWVPILEVLESEAAEAAATARHFHRHVAANLPQLGLAAALGTAVAIGSAAVSPDAWAWLSAPGGQAVGLAAVAMAAAVCARPLGAAWEILR